MTSMRLLQKCKCCTPLISLSVFSFKNEILPYHKNGKYILVIPPSHSVALMFDGQEWLKNTLKILRTLEL